MAYYTYKRNYKDLASQKELLEKSFEEMLENDPRKEQLMSWFKDYKQTHESIRKIADDTISDTEHDKDEEIEELNDEVEELLKKVSSLEEESNVFDVKGLDDEMKVELFQIAMKKYSLAQLEERLGGNKFQLM